MNAFVNISIVVAVVSCVQCYAGWNPALQFRLESDHTSSDEAWARTFAMLRDVPGLCDEIWFGTGFGMPKLEAHRANAERIRRAMDDVRGLGWKPGLQIQATIGHGGPFTEGKDYSERNWTGWTGSTGVEDKCCNCPRDPRFLEYIRQMSRIYAALRPSSLWIDDDLRIDNHDPATRGSLDGCWCDRCVADFNAETGGKWTRKTLDAAARKDARLRIAYEEFAIRSIAAIARIIGEEFHAASPETVLALQHNARARRTVEAIIGVLYEVGGRPVGYRPGAGAYYDVNPNDQIVKSLSSAQCKRDFAHPEQVGLWTCEIACFPRTYGTKSAQTIIMEGFTGLVHGMDAASALVLNYGKESEDLYLRARLRPMAAAAPVLRAYAKSCEGTTAVGFTADSGYERLYRFAQTGVPTLIGVGKSCGRISAKEIGFDRCRTASGEVQKLRDALDARAGGTPAVLESPFVGMMLPRVAADGTLRNVALMNLRLDEQGPLRLRLRGVPSGVNQIVWREMRGEPKTLAVSRDGDVCRVEIPSLGAWNGGYLEIQAGALPSRSH